MLDFVMNARAASIQQDSREWSDIMSPLARRFSKRVTHKALRKEGQAIIEEALLDLRSYQLEEALGFFQYRGWWTLGGPIANPANDRQAVELAPCGRGVRVTCTTEHEYKCSCECCGWDVEYEQASTVVYSEHELVEFLQDVFGITISPVFHCSF